MGSTFHEWGRALAQLGMPAYQKARWVWQSIAGSEEDRLRAELDLGRTLAAHIRTASRTPARPADQQLVQAIAASLAARLKDRRFRFRVEALDLPEPTALALPGGSIFVSSRLLELCHRYPDEIAFVIGHEMAHVTRGHAADRFLQESVMQALANRLSRASPLGGLVKDATLHLLSSTYSQDCEFEADEFGARLAHAAGHHPLAGVRLFDRLQKLHEDRTPLGQYFSSHPTPTERMIRLGRLWKREAASASRSAGLKTRP